MGELLSLMAAAAGVMILMLAAILLAHRRMRRGEIVQATVYRVDLEDPDACGAVSVTLTYTFPWQGRTLEIRQRPAGGSCRPKRGSGRRCAGTPPAAGCGSCPPAVPW